MKTREKHIKTIASEMGLRPGQVHATAELLVGRATVPFIARYRKEATGGLDEVSIIAIGQRLEQLHSFDERLDTILRSIEDQGKLTPELRAKLLEARTLAELEDLYLPYRPKRRTRATIAKEKGLEPLSAILLEQNDMDPGQEAVRFVDPEKGLKTVEDALAGARDIIAEWINEDAEARSQLRSYFAEKARIRSKVIKGKEQQGAKYKDYYAWEEPAAACPSHRILAIRRGAGDGVLSLRIIPDEQGAIEILERLFIKKVSKASEHVRLAIKDGYRRLLLFSLETEIRLETKKRADEEAINVFSKNLRELLMAPPLGQKSVLAVDPGYRTGCKVVCLDPYGTLLRSETVYPLEPHNRKEESEKVLRSLVDQFSIEVIAVGNGTGGRESDQFCRRIDFGRTVPVIVVNESGASVYSASETAREEFPDYDATVRGAVSIGRRLMDPLAELVKIDPKSIGVGQYQHDVDQKELKKALHSVVVSCVNTVGVEINTASKQLLSYVSGLSERLAEQILDYRKEHGALRSRTELMRVSGMGMKTFEQAAGFLRIHGAENPLDASAVHPERYPVVEAMARDLNCTVTELMTKSELRDKISLDRYVTDTVGMPTLTDILEELAKPGRDPRDHLEIFTFAEGIHEVGDLAVGMKLPGVVTNVTNFGAFVDIGVHQDGLVHISELADRFVRDPHDVVQVNKRVTATVIGIDEDRKRISLSMRNTPLKPRTKNSTGKPPGGKKEKHQRQSKSSSNPFAKALKDWGS
ncbi:MAG: Tex family protein [Thermodesulfobacteriota bacterium]